MATQWLRLWHDMPNDPKWRTIARISKRSISEVVAVYVHVLVIASNANERGRTQALCPEDVASALDLETEHVEQIMAAMQGRVLDGDHVTGWEKRQPEREDGSAERARAWRERKKSERNAEEQKRTQANASEHQDKDKDTDTEKETPPIGGVRAEARKVHTLLPDDWQPDKRALDWIASFGVTLEQAAPVIHEFKTYWGGRSQRRADWSLAFIRNGKVEGSLIKLRDSANGSHQRPDTRSRAQRHHDKLREIAERSIARERGAS